MVKKKNKCQLQEWLYLGAQIMSLVISPSFGSVLPCVDFPLNRADREFPGHPWLGLHTSPASGMGSVPAGGTQISQPHGMAKNK